MIRMTRANLRIALSWLTTSKFEQSPFDLLMVLLEQEGSITELLNQPSTAHVLHSFDSTVLMTLKPTSETPTLPAPIHNSAIQSWVNELLQVQSTFLGHSTKDAWSTTLNLLGIDQNTLPALYLRIRGSEPIIIPIEDGIRTTQFIMDISMKIQMARLAKLPLQPILIESLKTNKMYGYEIAKEEQSALDMGILNGKHGLQESDWKVSQILEEAGLPQQLMGTESQHRFRHSGLVRSVSNFLEPHHQRSLRTAVKAHKYGDFDTVCRNIGAIIEDCIAGSLVHIVRGDHGITLPEFIDRQDPQLGKVLVDDVNINARHHYVGDVTLGQKLRWKAPTLQNQLYLILFASDANKLSIELPAKSWETLSTLAQAFADLRNPAAHGVEMSKHQAEQTWSTMEEWYNTGCAEILYKLRQSLLSWPQVDTNILDEIQIGRLQKQQYIQQVLKSWSTEAYEAGKQWTNTRFLDHQIEQHVHAIQYLTSWNSEMTKPADFIKLKFTDLMKTYFDDDIVFEGFDELEQIFLQQNKTLSTLPKYFTATSQLYKRIGSLLADHSTDISIWRSVLDTAEQDRALQYRTEKSKSLFQKRIEALQENRQRLERFNSEWRAKTMDNLTCLITRLTTHTQELETKRADIATNFKKAKSVQDCVASIELAIMEKRVPVCTCAQRHPVEILL